MLANRLNLFPTKLRRKTLFILVGARHIECGVMTGSGSAARWESSTTFEIFLEADRTPLQALIATIQALPAQPDLSGQDEMRVVMADGWLAVAGIPWSTNLARAEHAQTYACAQLTGSGFEVEPGGTLRVDDAPFGEPRLAVAYPATLLLALEHWADRSGVRLVSLLPLSVVAWKLAQKMGHGRFQALAVFDQGGIVVIRSCRRQRIGRTSLNEVKLRMIDDTTSREQALNEFWQRLCLREPLWANVEKVALLDLGQSINQPKAPGKPFEQIDLPPSSGVVDVSLALHNLAGTRVLRHVLDACESRVSWTLSQWVILVATVLFTGSLTIQAINNEMATRDLTAKLSTTVSAPQPTARSIPWSREELARVQAVNTAIRELNLPIAELLRVLEPPRDIRVAVLSVETAGNFVLGSATQHPRVKILAEARTSADMARYVTFVAEQKPFVSAYLTQHEIVESTAERPYRFMVEAQWND